MEDLKATNSYNIIDSSDFPGSSKTIAATNIDVNARDVDLVARRAG